MKKALVLSAAAAIGIVAICTTLHAENVFNRWVSSDSEIQLPEDFRKDFAHLGSWYVPDGPASGFHDVYTEAATIEAYRRTGAFPDGATLVKELRPAAHGDYTTGSGVGHATDDIKQWFVMIKDTQGRFSNDARWGDGWGWALFTADSAGKNAASDYSTDCIGCHIPAKENDYIYVDAYPSLKP